MNSGTQADDLFRLENQLFLLNDNVMLFSVGVKTKTSEVLTRSERKTILRDKREENFALVHLMKTATFPLPGSEE